MAGVPVDRFDGCLERRHIESFDEAPDQTNPVILRHQFVETDGPPFGLSALGTTQSRQPAAQPLRRNVIRQDFEQPSHFIRRHPHVLRQNTADLILATETAACTRCLSSGERFSASQCRSEPSCTTSRSPNLVNSLSKNSFTVPVGPCRCFEMISSALLWAISMSACHLVM